MSRGILGITAGAGTAGAGSVASAGFLAGRAMVTYATANGMQNSAMTNRGRMITRSSPRPVIELVQPRIGSGRPQGRDILAAENLTVSRDAGELPAAPALAAPVKVRSPARLRVRCPAPYEQAVLNGPRAMER